MAKKSAVTSKPKEKQVASKAKSSSPSPASTLEKEEAGTSVFSLDYDPIENYNIEKGPVRQYLSVDVSDTLSKLRNPNTTVEWIVLSLLLVLTCVVRLYGLSYPDSVVFDEVHFGKFAAKYIKGTYFFDVHPPLSKMMFAGIGSLAGFKGNFNFENIGDFFPKDVPYYALRLFSATCGVLTAIFMYLTLRCSGVKPWIGLLATSLFVVENSFVTISRYILLDAPLILFISGAAYAYKKYEIYPEDSFKSFKSLVFTGVCLGMALSSKWVGLFTVAWIGLLCALKLWFYIGDLNKPLVKTTTIATKWGSILLGLPIVIYMLSFSIHFKALNTDSEGASILSPAYRASLDGNHVPNNIIGPVGFGSVISVRHINTNGGYLHSHNLFYEEGSKQQQITLYPHLDGNNDWLVEDYNNTNVENYTSFEQLKHGTKIRLKHINTQKRLHSHDHKPPVSHQADWQKEASAYGFENFEGDPNDDFIVEIDRKLSKNGEAQEVVKAIDTKFRLRHAMSGCLLFSHDTHLPDGGQQEVTCAHSGIPELTVWYIEANTHPLLANDPKVERVSYPKFGFWEKFVESNIKMWKVNNGFTESHVYQSDPTTWPFLTRGIAYWGKDHRSVYLLGNAVVWWLSTATVAVFAGLVLFELVKWQLGYELSSDKAVINFHIQITHYLLGWFIHYAPFFIMGRQLFLHHYLPAYYFLIMAFAHLLDLFVSHILSRKKIIGLSICVALLSSTYYFFETHKGFGYGTPLLKETCEKGKWMSGWDYSCDAYLESWDEYSNYTLSSEGPKQTSFQATNINELFKDDGSGNKQFDSNLVFEQDKRLAELNNQQQDQQPYDHQIANSAGPAVEVGVEDVKKNQGPKKFIGPDGQEIDEEVALQMIAEQGGRLMKVEETSTKGGATQSAAPTQKYPDVGIDDIMKDEGPKKFMDQFGNELDPEVAMGYLNQGGHIVNVERHGQN